jgi:hypothetical protein
MCCQCSTDFLASSPFTQFTQFTELSNNKPAFLAPVSRAYPLLKLHQIQKYYS